MNDFLSRLDFSLAATGKSQTEASVEAGHRGIIANWRGKGQSPTIKSLKAVGDVLDTDPAWLAYADLPEPMKTMPGYHAQPANTLSDKMEAVHKVWSEDGFGLPLFITLERTGLDKGIYLLGTEGHRLKYDHVGTQNIHTLGMDWWKSAFGKFVGECDPDPEFAYGCLNHYNDSLENDMVRRDRCEAESYYTGEAMGWSWDRLILPCDGKLLVVNEVRISAREP